MANYYYKTCGQAWGAIMDAFTAYRQMTYNPVDFNISWNSAPTINGGYLEVSGTTMIGPPFANGRYYAAEAQQGARLQIGATVRAAGMQAVPEIEFVDDPDYASALDTMFVFKNAKYQMLFETMYGTVSAEAELDSILDEFGAPSVYRYVRIWQNQNDQAIDFTTILVLNTLPATSALTKPINPGYQDSGPVVVSNIIQTAPSLDVDATVNPGGGIYSITSKQLTTP